MTSLAIGDIHGRTIWKDIINKEEFDRVIFLGDYFDTRDNISAEAQMHNFLDIIEYKKTGGKEVILLLGNHDYHYLDLDGPYSGYQPVHASAIKELITKNWDHLRICYGDYKLVFSHAGLTSTWLKNVGHSGESNYIDYVNYLFRFKPLSFHFYGPEQTGDNISEGPLWVRPRSLLKDAYHHSRLTQVVGHTTMKSITPYKDRYWFIDTLGTSREYLKITEEKSGVQIFTTERLNYATP